MDSITCLKVKKGVPTVIAFNGYRYVLDHGMNQKTCFRNEGSNQPIPILKKKNGRATIILFDQKRYILDLKTS